MAQMHLGNGVRTGAEPLETVNAGPASAGRSQSSKARAAQNERESASAKAQRAARGHKGVAIKNGKAVNGAAAEVGSARPSTRRGRGLSFTRRFTDPKVEPLEAVTWERRASVITNPDGSVVFRMEGAEIPAGWSQLATDIVVSKYFRKAGLHGKKELGETSVRQVVHRLARTIREAGERFGGYFASTRDADAFEAELSYLLVHQYGAFNSPVWFNCGLWHRYEISGTGGNFAWNEHSAPGAADEIAEVSHAYERPQCSACFIQAVSDDLMSIYDLAKSEARLFKYGSGTGTNFSHIRGKQEKLSGGGTSSGLMSFLEVLDRAAGSTKSGGTTRRAAKMVCLDMDHPEIVDFINWKVREEKKAQTLIAGGYPADFNGEAYHTVSGQNSNNSIRVSDDFMKATTTGASWQTRARTTNEVVDTLDAKDLWRQIAQAAWACADPGVQYDTTINKWHTCPNTAPIKASNPCVTGDTLVATAEGPRRIDTMLDAPCSVIGADGELHPIAAAFPTGTKPVYRLTTRAGLELKLTGDHRVLTKNRGDVRACELTKDDVLVLGRPAFGSTALDERLAEFLGLMVGDGCISGEQQIAMLTLAASEADLAKHVHARLTAYRQENAADGRAARETAVREHSTFGDEAGGAPAGTLRINTSARCVVDELQRYASLAEGSAGKALSPRAFALDKPSLAAMLRGLFTADGTVADYGERSQYVGLDSTSLVLLQQVQQMLLAFGVKAKLYRDRRVVGQTTALLPDGKGGRREYPVQQLHSLRISKSSRVVFEREIGFISASAKAEQLTSMNRRVSTYDDRFEDRVQSLTFLGEEPVYDLTEPVTDHFVANGVVVHNCSEYMFLDDSACNLASLNLTKFLGSDGSFDVEAYRAAVRVFFVAQEILVDFSSYPTKVIAKNSHDYRPLGLGYANLGTLLMLQGIPYDSDAGRSMAGALTAIMCGHAYRVSAEMAGQKGPFAGYAKNRDPMLRVMNMHRDAAYQINRDRCPEQLWRAACADWDEAVRLGEQHGYRNAQATVLAPTGTIGLLMDCDTTGIEPDFALVKFKKLAGGGYFKIVNQSVPEALRRLGYDEHQTQEIVAFVSGTNTLLAAPHVNRATLKLKGLSREDLAKVEAAIPGVFDLDLAFAPWVLGAETYERLGISAEARNRHGFSLLSALGFSSDEIAEANDHIVGRMTVEGAPHLALEHYAVFDCANRCGKTGRRFLAPMSHVRMMAAAQPFLSGAISKTVNLPNEATVDEVQKIYEEGWKLGLKAVALYRDGCKASQPLSSQGSEKQSTEATVTVELQGPASLAGEVLAAKTTVVVRPTTGHHQVRVRLPTRRTGFTQEARVGGHKIYIRTGQYLDGSLGEIFIDMHKEGAAFRSMMNCFAMAVSLGLQYGVPLDAYVDQFTFTRFEPQGMVEGHDNIKLATSIVDYIFRALGVEYLQRYDLAHVQPAAVAIQDPSESRQQEDAAEPRPRAALAAKPATGGGALDAQLEDMMGDAPLCDGCGHITVRNGACYRCLNCGNSMGCS
jgi:ribonucleoside-diphosphate reductase alpha chain